MVGGIQCIEFSPDDANVLLAPLPDAGFLSLVFGGDAEYVEYNA